MGNFTSGLIVVAGIIVLVIISVATYTWVTMPPDLDPNSLPSRTLEEPSANYEAAVKEGRSIARELIAEEKLPGLSLAVAVDGEIVWAEGFRFAHLENETPVTPETLFRIGGISQTFTAAAAGLLFDREQLSFDAPIQEYVSSFPEKRWPITARQLMAHTSGLRPHRGEGGLFRGVCANDEERLAIFAGDSLVYRPGTNFRYSSYGWMLVGAAVAAAADEPYLEFLKREIFEPLEMTRTEPDIAGQKIRGTAQFYYPRLMLKPAWGLHEASDVDFSCYLAAVGFLSTPSDLVRFGSAMMGDELLNQTTVKTLQTPTQLESGESTGQGLGWTVQSLATDPSQEPTKILGQGLGKTVVGHTLGVGTVGGQVAGGTASLLTVPEHKIAIAVATNVTGSENASLIATRLADTFVRFLQAN
ncbi:MAG: beta-lactamase family protein [Candidatus Eisenbacteria bacterium]|uniref:Beta-lactamase family protein n=1 Tax=Eiseniibacteriota bacterium TaxID=2212470 RepID=A0A7Y2EG98_UNCEI|nr:beta-lactamase family protein [Candidatus Eisenbacteria bacterium]